MTSAAVAVTLSAGAQGGQRGRRWRLRDHRRHLRLHAVVNVIERPDGIKIAAFFIAAIVVVSLISRAVRSTELRTEAVELDETAERWSTRLRRRGTIRFIANHPDERTTREYLLKEREEREASHIPPGDPVLFLEVTVRDASEFATPVRVTGERDRRVPRAARRGRRHSERDRRRAAGDPGPTAQPPHVYFGWAEGNPLKYLARFIFFGEGDIAPITHEILRRAEPDPAKRPIVHVG